MSLRPDHVPRLPPFASLLKSRDVEDPVNVWVHRPLAYGVVALVFRTPVTPNLITLAAMLVGIAAGACWLEGSSTGMVLGGVLLWSSAILDGADGILARAKNMQSDFGRALDGSADMVVAISTVIPGFLHLWWVERNPLHPVLAVAAIGLTVVHLYMYDFYKESFLRATRLDRGGEGEDPDAVEQKLAALEARGGHFIVRFCVKNFLLPYLRAQQRFVRVTNPGALREGVHSLRTEETARIYRAHNAGPMRVWAAISLAPHSYLMAIAGMVDRLDAYLWIRLVMMNALFVVALVWQRRATERTRAALDGTSLPSPAMAS